MSSALARQWWTAERFGLTPRKLATRVAGAGLPRVLVVSLPKAGTHLVERAVCLHPRLYRRFLPTLNPENVGEDGLAGVLRAHRPGQVVVAHLPFDPAYRELLADVTTLFVVRDPRDMAVSLAHYIESRGDHPLHFAYSERPDERSRIELAILGDAEARPPAPSLESLLAGFAGWLDSGALVVRFEDLIGARGGGDDATQAQTIRAVYDRLGLDVPPRLTERLFSNASPTFRKGQIGGWRESFDADLEALFEREVGKWMEVYGYR
jgi:sulfotransferase 6B1